MKTARIPKDVQDFQLKQASTTQIIEGFEKKPISSSLIAADGKRGLLYIGHNNKLTVLKPGIDASPEWKIELELPHNTSLVALSCDCSYLLVALANLSALIYNAAALHKNSLDLLNEVKLSTSSGNVIVLDLKWNPTIPGMFCAVTSDHTISCFKISADNKVEILGMEKTSASFATCLAWSPKGKQIVVGCKNGNILQMKPELKVVRMLSGPGQEVGMTIAILWVSNYQFCACYLNPIDERVSVLIVDAPKGGVTPSFTNYEDVTFGTGDLTAMHYYFEHIPEWGIILAASNHSSELAVLGMCDDGISWEQWQLMDSCRAQFPLSKQGNETYSLGLDVDKSATTKLQWGPDSTLPHPVPLLHTFGTSGQLLSFHIINLKPNAAPLCTPPSEIIAAPPPQKQTVPAADFSFNISSGATSTPRPKKDDFFGEKPNVVGNFFGDASKPPSFTFQPAESKGVSVTPQTEVKPMGFPLPSTAAKPIGLSGQGDGKTWGLFSQPAEAPKLSFLPQQTDPKTLSSFLTLPSKPVPEAKPLEFPLPSTKSSGFLPQAQPEKPIGTPATVLQTVAPQTELKIPKPKEDKVEAPPILAAKTPQAVPEPPKEDHIDDSVRLKAYQDEIARFEKELKSKLVLPSWTCGTNEEREQLVTQSANTEEFLRELHETTSSLYKDIEYLKALLLQSFAWIEEAKSKNSAKSTEETRNHIEKLTDLECQYYQTESLLKDAEGGHMMKKFEDMAEEYGCGKPTMKIPSLEVIYQTLMRHSQIINQEKAIVDVLSKKFHGICRKDNISGLNSAMAGLDLSQAANKTQTNDTAIDTRCKVIENNTRKFSREKQLKLLNLLTESSPRIIKAVRPTAVQGRLEATLSSLSLMKKMETPPKQKPTLETTKSVTSPKPKPQNPLANLNNFVSGVGGTGLSAIGNTSMADIGSTNMKGIGVPSMTGIGSANMLGIGNANMAGVGVANMTGIGVTNVTGIANANMTGIGNANMPSIGGTNMASIGNVNMTSISGANMMGMGITSMPSINGASKSGIGGPVMAGIGGAGIPSIGGASMTGVSGTSILGKIPFGSPNSTIIPPSVPIKPNENIPSSFSPSVPSIQPTSNPSALLKSFSKVDSTNFTITPPKVPETQEIVNNDASKTTLFSSTFKNFSDRLPSTAIPTVPATTVKTTTPLMGFSTKPTATPDVKTTAPSFAPVLKTDSAPAFTIPKTTAPTKPTISVPSQGGLDLSAMSFGLPSTGLSITPVSEAKSPSAPVSLSIPTSDFRQTTLPNISSQTSFFGQTTNQTSVTISPLPLSASPVQTIFNKPTLLPQSPSTDKVSIAPINLTSTAATAATSPPSLTFKTMLSPTSTPTSTPTTQSIFGKSTMPVQPFVADKVSSAPTTTVSTVATTVTATPTSSMFGGALSPVSMTPVTTTPQAVSLPPAPEVSSTTATPATATSESSTFKMPPFTSSVSTFSGFGNSVLGNTATLNFGSTNAASSISPAFGSQTTPSTGTSIFANTYAATAPATTTGSVFGNLSTPTATVFSGSFSNPAGNTSIFKTQTSTFAAPAATGSIFGAPAKPKESIFGGNTAPAVPGGQSMFGGSTVPAAPVAGGSPFGAQSVFGQAPAFASKPVFGSLSTDFGAKPPGSTFGAMSPFGAAPTPGFGSSPMLGSSIPQSTSPQKIFGTSSGSSTFEALATQSNELTFGSLAQKTPEAPKPAPFAGGSSFSSWR